MATLVGKYNKIRFVLVVHRCLFLRGDAQPPRQALSVPGHWVQPKEKAIFAVIKP
jgi:hypothetical protein